MHQRHHRHLGGQSWGRRGPMRPFPSREELVERLESYQRDLEQELANLADVLRHLRSTPPAEQPAQPAPHEG
jgi:hypothetical protein